MRSMVPVESRQARQGDERWWGFSVEVSQSSVINGHSGSFVKSTFRLSLSRSLFISSSAFASAVSGSYLLPRPDLPCKSALHHN